MTDRVLRWYIDGGISRTKIEVGGAHVLDTDYKPTEVNMHVRIAGSGSDHTVIDINNDGTSIFDSRPALSSQTDKSWTTIPKNALRKGSVITMDIDQIPDQDQPRDLTVELYLDKT